LLLLTLVASGGCRGMNKQVLKHAYSKGFFENGRAHWYCNQRYELSDPALEDVNFEGTIAIDDANVSYQSGLEQQAYCIANQINQFIATVKQRTGLKIGCRAKVYLLRVDEVPQNYDMSFASGTEHFIVPLFVKAGDESCEANVYHNFGYPTILMHELTEMSLVFHRDHGRILPDARGTVLFFEPKVLNYTRWFREGLANYAALLAYEAVRPTLARRYIDFSPDIEERPFSALDKVGTKLFKWHQYSRNIRSRDYYNASLGLFLLITSEFGPNAIEAIMLRIDKENYLDGVDLIRITNATLNANIKKLVADFHFPRTGLKTRRLTSATAINENLMVSQGLYVESVEAGGLAETAGIQKGDVLTRVEETAVVNNLDFELALYELLHRKTVNVGIYRKDTGEQTLSLQIWH